MAGGEEKRSRWLVAGKNLAARKAGWMESRENDTPQTRLLAGGGGVDGGWRGRHKSFSAAGSAVSAYGWPNDWMELRWASRGETR